MARTGGLSAGGAAWRSVPPLGARLDLCRDIGADPRGTGRAAPGPPVRPNLSAQRRSAAERRRMSEHRHQLRLLEALLFAAPGPLAADDLAARLGEPADVAALLHELAETYAEHGVNLVRLAGGWIFRTAPDLAPRLKSERVVPRRLSRAAVETLAIIAYHQPATRTE